MVEEVTMPKYIKIKETQEGAPVIRFAWYRPMHGLLLAFILIAFGGTFAYLLSQSENLKPEFMTIFILVLGIIFLLILFFVLRLILNTTTIELADYAIIVKVRPISGWQTLYIPRDDIQSISLDSPEAIQTITFVLNSGETVSIGTELYKTEETQFIYQTIARQYGL